VSVHPGRIPRPHETTDERSQQGDNGTATYVPLYTPSQWSLREKRYLQFSFVCRDTKYCTVTESAIEFIIKIRNTVMVCIIGAKFSKSCRSYDFDSN
jgi:hypothetical protein